MNIFDITIILAASQTLFLFTTVWIYQRRTYIGKLIIAFSLCTLAYLYHILMELQSTSIEGFILGRVAFLIPGVIWLMAFALFKHERKVPTYAWILIGTYSLLKTYGTVYHNLHSDQIGFDFRFFMLHIVPQIINIGIYIHTLCLAALEYRQDLIEERRRMRVAFVAVLGSFWLIVSLDVSFNVLLNGGLTVVYGSSVVIQMVRDILMFPALFAINLIVFRIINLGSGSAELIEMNRNYSNSNEEIFDAKDVKIKNKLLGAMKNEKLYTRPGLTIGGLADYLGVQEYKLRSVINRMLKYSNFSHFLNKYRMEDAERRLLTTNDPIFNIGLDVGYTSLSSFHKAFKESHGTTPKEYRILNRRGDSSGIAGKSPQFSASSSI